MSAPTPRWRVQTNRRPRRPAARRFIVLYGNEPVCMHAHLAWAVDCAHRRARADALAGGHVGAFR